MRELDAAYDGTRLHGEKSQRSQEDPQEMEPEEKLNQNKLKQAVKTAYLCEMTQIKKRKER